MVEVRNGSKSARTYPRFRVLTLMLAAVLSLQSVWLLLAELSRSGVYRLPTDAATAAAAQDRRLAANVAAKVGAIRGDLWAEAAFTYADLVWNDATQGADLQEVTKARSALDHALSNAPHLSAIWLLRASLASRYSWQDVNAREALKMSYYTGPSEQDLMPLRFRIAMLSEAFDDPEMRELIERDVRVLLSHQQKSAITLVYDAASPNGRRFIEQAVSKIDPSAVKLFRTSVPKQSLPD